MSTPITLRPFGSDELVQAGDLMSLVFAGQMDSQDLQAEGTVMDFDRTIGAFDGDQLVGSLGTYSFDMSVPGGSLSAGGTTWVAVRPTHRRRGIMRQLMTHHLADAHDRGEPFVALWASEAAIYGRFGFGPAIDVQTMTVAVDAGLTWHDTAPGPADEVRMVPLEQAAQVLAPIYDACRSRRAGMHARSRDWWYFQTLSQRKSTMSGAPGKYVAVAQIDGSDVAYAVYGLAEGPGSQGRPDGVVKVTELAGVTAHAEAAIWRYLIAHDLIASLEARRRPVDDVLPLLLSDSRRVQRRRTDGLYVRVLDLPAALQGRSYRASVGLTVEVHDDLFSANEGTWRIEVAPEGASVEPTTDGQVDVELDIRALGALYLGSVTLRQLVSAGMAQASHPDVIAAVDGAFTTDEAGWPPEIW
ncbi:MAG: GNAT family N-acetyltransferase [Euzebya sp.]